jgi:TBC1 domain family protein 5
LFGREFAFDDVLAMWDAIFTDDPSLEIVDLVCLNMILRLHWDCKKGSRLAQVNLDLGRKKLTCKKTTTVINADYNTALTILLRYPPLDNQISPQLFVTNAIYLRENFTQAGASTLVEKYTGKPLPIASSSSSSTTATSLILPSTPGKLRIHMPTRSASNFEDILQGAAKGVFQRGEKWGINKALRDAVEEVKKGVREIQAVQTPQLPVRHTRRGSGNGADKGGAVVDPSVQLVVLERRNVALSKMLKKAIDDLWLHHESVVGEAGTADKTTADDGDDEKKKKKEKSANALSMAIAKVQFVQVYLEDASVPLFSDEEEAEEVDADTNTDSKNDKVVTTKMQQPQMKESSSTQPATPTSKDTEAFKADTPHQPSTPVQNKTTAMPTKIETETETTRNKTSTKTTATTTTTTTATKKSTSSTTADKLLNFQTPRPTLAQSSFSWMLGQSPDFSSTTTKSNSSINSNSNNNNFAQAKALAPSDIRRRSRSFLFGHDDDDDDDDDDDKNNNNNSNTKGGRNSPERRKKDNNSISGGKRGKKQQVKKDVLFEQDAIEEEFDLGALEEEKKKEREKAKAEAGGAHGIKGR